MASKESKWLPLPCRLQVPQKQGLWLVCLYISHAYHIMTPDTQYMLKKVCQTEHLKRVVHLEASAKRSAHRLNTRISAPPVFLPGEFHGQRSLTGYRPWGHKESDKTEQLTHTHHHTGNPAEGQANIKDEINTEMVINRGSWAAVFPKVRFLEYRQQQNHLNSYWKQKSMETAPDTYSQTPGKGPGTHIILHSEDNS